ncbi:MAG TPA: hypothetical protein VFZ65_05150, partial [Planctomycetota bacterium]|nr:hypothetical protein [Planctomycetota bacterium]
MQRPAALFFVSFLSLGVTALAQEPAAPRVMLHYAAFDPLSGEPTVPEAFTAKASSGLFLVQFTSEPTQADREALHGLGAEEKWYAPYNGYVVRADADRRQEIAALERVRWVGSFHPAYKLELDLLGALIAGPVQPDRYVVVMVDPKRDEAALVAAVQRVGGTMWRYAAGNLLIEADLTGPQVVAIAAENTVLWIQRVTPVGTDDPNVRIQGGSNYIEAMAGHTGKGVRGHIMEGIYPTHPEYAANAWRTVPPTIFSGSPTTHGNSTFGIIFAAGVNANVRGVCPDGQGMFTDYNYIINSPVMTTAQNTRYGVVSAITDPTQPWKAMFETASWGYTPITTYDARSAEMDWII